ncbi:MAG: T9SS type A sorting domain-containing protein [Bacteroidia bacterium]|jgi:hypothetical protein|nr:T9SS type A sorting domain-containing protein [Bacteroidia bacterium]
MKLNLLLIFILLFIKGSSAFDYYWIGGSGNWNDYANHWATTSGGSTFQVGPPTQNDIVYFDVNSFNNSSDKVTIDSNADCKSFNYDNFSYAEIECDTITRQLNVYGDINITTPFNFSFDGELIIRSTSSIRTSFTPLFSTIVFDGTGETFTLADSLLSENKILFLNGSLFTQSYAVYLNSVSCAQSTTVKLIDFESSDIHVKGFIDLLSWYGTFDFSGANAYLTEAGQIKQFILRNMYVYNHDPDLIMYGSSMDSLFIENISHVDMLDFFCNYAKIQNTPGFGLCQMDAGQSNIDYIDASADSSSYLRIWLGESSRTQKIISAQDLTIDGSVYNDGGEICEIDSLIAKKNLNITGFAPIIDYFNQLNVKYVEVANNGSYCLIFCDRMQLQPNTSHVFESRYAITIDTLIASGSSGQLIYFSSDQPGVQDTIIMANDFCGDYINFQDMFVMGNASYYTGANSTDAGNNTGWNFSACSVNMADVPENNSLVIYPIPANDHIYFNEPVDAVSIYNITGELIFSSREKQITDLSVASLKSNFYTLEITNKNGIARRKLIVN